MSTRNRTKRNRTSSKSSADVPASTTAKEEASRQDPVAEAPGHVARSDLPPSRPRKEILTPVAPPGQKAPLNRFIYILAMVALLFAGWYTYVTTVGLMQWKDDVGWWGIAVGRSGKQDSTHRSLWGWNQKDVKRDVEEDFSRLASALGIPATDVASAVKPFVPLATLSSLAPRATGEAMKVLFEEDSEKDLGGGGAGPGKVNRFDDPLDAGL